MTARLAASNLTQIPAAIQRPPFDPAALRPGIVHLGIGAFHRAHQAVFTEDAIAARGGDWGIVGASLQRADVPDAITAQGGLYSVEILNDSPAYRVMGVMKRALFAPRDRPALLAALGAPAIHAVTLSVSEKGYCLDTAGMLDFSHPDIAADLRTPDSPNSAVGWVALGLEQRRRCSAGPLTILSCDNLQSNGEKLANAVAAFADRAWPGLASYIADNATFPLTLVDCIVPAADASHRARIAAVLGMADQASVQRESYARWVIQNRFAGPLPAWRDAGAEIVDDITASQRLKLHVLNTTHSALAYLGLPRGHRYVRQAIADPELSAFVEQLVTEEIAPGLAPLDVATYWRTIRVRFANPLLNHRLDQVAEDGSVKLPQRLFPLLADGALAGRPIGRMAAIVQAWLTLMATEPVCDPANAWFTRWAKCGADRAAALDNVRLFPAPFRSDPQLRAAIQGNS
jgi:fructuronate reductase